MIVSATCGWLDSAERNHCSMYIESPKPRAMANITAATGTMASMVLNESAVA